VWLLGWCRDPDGSEVFEDECNGGKLVRAGQEITSWNMVNFVNCYLLTKRQVYGIQVPFLVYDWNGANFIIIDVEFLLNHVEK